MPKLPKGLYRRGRSFYCRLYEQGREARRSLGTDYEMACRTLRDLKRSGEAFSTSEVTVKDASARWIETAVSNGRNEKGVRDARTRMRRHTLPFMGHLMVGRVQQEDLRRFRTWLEGRGATLSLVHHVLTDTRALFRWCEASELIPRAPIPRRWLPRLPERAPDRLSEQEVEKLATVPEPYGFVIRLALATGLRWGELARAEGGDVWNGVLVVKQSKSAKIRRIPLPEPILKEVAGRSGRLVPFVDAKTVAAAVRKFSGLNGFHMHQTRHTYACRYLERGGSLHALQQLLGHSTVLVTQRYARLSDEAVLAEHRRLELAEAGDGPAQRPAQRKKSLHPQSV